MKTGRLRCVAITLLLATSAYACGDRDAAAGDAVPDVPEAGSADGVPDVAEPAAGNADRQELADYRLTMADVDKWSAAVRNIRQRAEQDPELARQMEEDDSGDSLDEIEASLERMPAARDAVEDAGLTPREYAVIGYALLKASMAQAAVQQGADAAGLARDAGIHPDNLQFVQTHEARLKVLMR